MYPGNTIWSYRFPLAMQLKTTIITMEGLKGSGMDV